MKNKPSLFKLFTPKSITKDNEYNEIPTNFKGFFVMFIRKFWNLSNLSLLYSFVNLPILFIFLAYALMEQSTVVYSPMFSAFYGFSQVSDSASFGIIYPFVSMFGTMSVPTTASYICIGIACLGIFTFGVSNAGSAYIIRCFNRGEPVFLISDFFSTIKRNWRQSLIVGILDIIISFVLVFDFMFWNSQPGFINGVFQYFALFLCVLYFIMRFYIYTILITFDLSIFKIFKDAFLLSFLGFKRNIVGLIGIGAVIYLSIFICTLFLPIGVMLPIVLTIALLMFIAGYTSYPVIKKYMIDPYYPEETDDVDEDDFDDGEDDEIIFEDRG